MKNIFLCICLSIFTTIIGAAQTTPAPTPLPQPTPTQQEIVQDRMLNQQQRDRQFNRVEAISRQSSATGISPGGGLLYGNPADLYRRTTNKELKVLAPKADDLRKFDDFLRQKDTGIIKLAADKGCFENPNIVVVTPDCLAFTMPGAGVSYSFRVKDYRIPRLADITYTKNSFQATGIRLHGFFAELGDIPLEQVNLQTKGLNYVVNFKTGTDFEKARDLDLQLIKGIKDDGFLYRRAVGAKDDTTYVLRSIAYKGKYLRAVQKTTYNELDFDKRKDVIVIFRIIRRDEDGSVTILWKQLAEQASPKIKLHKN